MSELLLASVLLLAFVNGANDNMKGVATLYGAGALSYGRALLLATASTGLGSLASIFLATALLRAFTAKGLVPDAALDPAFLCSVGLAAALTVLLATRLGLPISTTHSLLGGLAGAGWVAAGPAMNLGALGALFVVPLLASPLLATALSWAGIRAGRRASQKLGVEYGSCVCISGQWVPVDSAANQQPGGALALAASSPVLGMEVAAAEECRERYSGRVAGLEVDSAMSAGHLLSASLVGFARGLNDTPKILGLVVGAGLLAPTAGALAIAAAMAAGGVVAARRVTRTLARKLTPMTPGQGLAGNLATALLVIGASRLGVPVSTTHVSTGGIFGIGVASGELRWRAATGVLAAWVTTLPLAAVLGAALMAWLG
jgi:PiT family inorganic phosphate transporter